MIALLVGTLLGILNFVFNFWRVSSYNYPRPYSSVFVFMSFVTGSILEEVIWRGYVLRAMGSGLYGLLVSSLFFGLHHIGLSIKHFLFAAIAGLILGMTYIRTSLFWGVALGHVFYNIMFGQLSDWLFKLLFK